MKRFLVKLYKTLVRHKWELGFIETPLERVLKGEKFEVRWVKHNYKNRWFADPFILSITDKSIELLVEEFCDDTQKGRIAKLTIDKSSYFVVSNETVLDLPTHLSFPAILRKDKNIYIYPENSESGKLVLYKYDVINNKCTPLQVISHEPLTDAVLGIIYGDSYLLSTKLPDPNGKSLSIYHFDGEKCDKSQEIEFDENIARMAGDVFCYNEVCYRPAQESNNDTYGHSISIQRIDRQKDGFVFTEVQRIQSPHSIHKLGFHTFNVYGDMIVIDVKGFRHHIMGCFCYWLKKIVRYQ